MLAGLFAAGVLGGMAAAASSAQAAAGPGSLDPRFGAGGKVLTSQAGVDQEVNQALVSDATLASYGDILADGDALVPGTTRNQPVAANGTLVLYSPSGTLVSSFGSGGTAQPNGDIVAIGSSEDNTTGAVDIALARYLG